MRFCMITTFYPPYSFGGDGLFVQSLSNLLAKRGHCVEVIHCKDSYTSLGGKTMVSETLSHPSIVVHGLSSPFKWLSPVATQQTGKPLFKGAEIQRILSRGNFDVTHFHNVSLVGGPGLLSYGTGLKLYTIHEHWLICPMHTLFRDNREPCDEKRCIPCALHFHRPPQLWRYTNALRDAVRHIDMFIAATEFTRSLHLASGLPMNIVTLPAFHDSEPPPGLPGDIPVINRPFFLYAGRLERLKGVHTIIDTFRNRGDAMLLIAGAGSQGEELRRQTRDCPNVVFLGRVTRATLSRLYTRAVAVIVPSLATEVFPLVILEAFSARTPVIARDHGPLPEIVQESGGGLLFRSDSEFSERLHWMLAHPDERNRMGDAGYNTWHAKWTPEAHIDRYLSLVQQLRESKAFALLR